MILSNVEILKALEKGHIIITPPPEIPSINKPESPLNTTSLDLRLSGIISVPKKGRAFAFDLSQGGIAPLLRDVYETRPIDPEGGFALEPNKLVLSNTMETIHFPIISDGPSYSGRIEGRSSYARAGLLVHFTAPTIHSGYDGPITLELMNLGNNHIILRPGAYICQMIFEKVCGEIVFTPSQFHKQKTPEGTQ